MRKLTPLIIAALILISCEPINRKYSPKTVQQDTLDIKKSGIQKNSYELLRRGIAKKESDPYNRELSMAKTYSDILRVVIEHEKNKAKYFVSAFASSFLKQNPNYLNNDATKEEFDSKFEEAVIDTLRFVGVNMPLKLEGVKNSKGKYYVHFSTTIHGTEDKQFIHYFDILGEVSQKTAGALIEGKTYNVRFTPFSFTRSLPFIKEMTNKLVYTPSVNIRKKDYGNQYEVSLGVMVGAFDEIK